MKVLRGDLDNTSGNGLIYSEFENLKDKKIITVSHYGTVSQGRFITKFPQLEEKTKSMINQRNAIKTALSMYNLVSDEEIVIFSAGLINPDLESILDANDDLICGEGRYLDLTRATDETKLLLGYYFNQHFGRLERHKLLVEDREVQDEPIKTHKDFVGINIQDYILNHYVDPLLRAKRRKDILEITSIKQELARFSENSIFSRYTNDLVDSIITPGLLQKDLIRAYIHLISSLHLENYEEAQIHLTKINELKQV